MRNALLGEAVTEVDVATTLSPEQVTAACAAAGMGVHPTGIEHGTVTVVVDHQPFEVTTLRHDVETDGRRATVKFTDDWEADAAAPRLHHERALLRRARHDLPISSMAGRTCSAAA